MTADRRPLTTVRPKTTLQVRAIFGESRKCGLDDEQLRDTVESVTQRTRSISDLTYVEAERVIEKLKGKSFVPRRTLQYRRAKAGVKQVATLDQVLFIAALATQRDWTTETVKKFCMRQCGHTRPHTTEDANKIIEALKSMNKREGLWFGQAA